MNPDMGRYWDIEVSCPFPAWYPVTGYRHWTTSYFAMCGVEISNWTTTRDNKNYYLFSNSGLVNPGGFQGGYAVPAIGFPVRCIRE